MSRDSWSASGVVWAMWDWWVSGASDLHALACLATLHSRLNPPAPQLRLGYSQVQYALGNLKVFVGSEVRLKACSVECAWIYWKEMMPINKLPLNSPLVTQNMCWFIVEPISKYLCIDYGSILTRNGDIPLSPYSEWELSKVDRWNSSLLCVCWHELILQPT